MLEGKPFYFSGFCNYYMLTRAADKRGSGRKEVQLCDPQGKSAHVSGRGCQSFTHLCACDPATHSGACSFLTKRIQNISKFVLPVQVIQTLQKAQELGFTVLRMWAFADGPDEWNALQPQLEHLDEDVFA